MNICVDRMVKEIVDDELEYKKYKLSWEAKKIYDSLLPDIYYKYNIKGECVKNSSTKYYTIGEVMNEYIYGRKYFDIYYEDNSKNIENYVLNEERDKSRIYKQIANIFKIPSKQFEGAKIKKCDISIKWTLCQGH